MFELIFIALIAFAVSLLTLFSGFGLGTLLLPAFVWFFPVEVAVAATAIVHAANNVFKLILLGASAKKEVLIRFGVPAVVAAFVGAFLLSKFSQFEVLHTWKFLGMPAEVTLIKLIMGLLILGFAVFELIPRLQTMRVSPKYLSFGGVLAFKLKSG